MVRHLGVHAGPSAHATPTGSSRRSGTSPSSSYRVLFVLVRNLYGIELYHDSRIGRRLKVSHISTASPCTVRR